MKKNLLILFALLSFGFGYAQNTTIPDSNFEQALISLGYDTVLDGQVLTSNISNVTTLNVGGKNITDLTGIQAFTSLQALYCWNNQLTSLNLSGLTALSTLSCFSNQLTSLNLSGLTALSTLNCYSNQLTSLNLSGLTALSTLYCYDNQLTSLNLSGLTALYYLNCFGNQLTSLNLSGLTALTSLSCGSNQLTSLNLSGLTALTSLSCGSNQLTSLNLNGLTALTSLSCGANQLTSLNLSGLTALTYLDCQSNQLISLDVSGLTYLNCAGNQLTSLDTSGLTALTFLHCASNQLTSLNLSGLIALTYLDCRNNQLTSLDVSGLTALYYLLCPDNQLTSLDASGLSALTYFNCDRNRLTSLNLSGLTTLIYLDCNFNQLTSLNLSGLTALTYLSCLANQLVSLDASGSTALYSLDCNYNQLTSLDVSGLTALTTLYCEDNQLTSLDVSGLTSLTFLGCSNNQLTSLDASDMIILPDNSSTDKSVSAQSKFVSAQSKSASTTQSDTTHNTTDFRDNPNLTCIKVSNVEAATHSSIWFKNDNAYYSLSCDGSAQTFCYGAKVLDLVPNAADVKWYAASAGGTKLASTSLLSSKTYYYTRTVNGVVSQRVAADVVVPISIAGSISGYSGTICYGAEKTLTLSATHRGTVQWQSAPLSLTGTAGTFRNIQGEEDVLYTGNLTENTYFRAVVTNGGCSPKTTSPVKVTVYPQSVAGAISGGGISVCPGKNSTKLILSGYLGKIQWQYSEDNQNFTNISLYGTSSYYIAKNIATTTYYRAVVTKGVADCTPAFSDSVEVSVYAPTNAGSVSADNNVVCYGTSARLEVSEYDAGGSIQWQKATTMTGAYANVTTGTGFNTDNFKTLALTTSAYFRVKVTNNGCSSVNTPFLVTIQKAKAGTITGGTISPSIVCVDTPSELTLTGYTGENIQWYSSSLTSTASFTPIEGANSDTYAASNAVAGKKYYRASVSYPECMPVLTPIVYVVVAACSPNKTVESENTFNVNAYPNPFADGFAININSVNQELIHIKVYDMLGKLIEQREVKSSEVMPRIGLGCQTGIYNVIVNQATEQRTLRVIKL